MLDTSLAVAGAIASPLRVAWHTRQPPGTGGRRFAPQPIRNTTSKARRVRCSLPRVKDASRCIGRTDPAEEADSALLFLHSSVRNVVTTGRETGATGPILAADGIMEETGMASPADIPGRMDIMNSSGAQIEFSLETASRVRVEIFDASGRAVATVANEFVSAGPHGYRWNTRGVPSGIYFY